MHVHSFFGGSFVLSYLATFIKVANVSYHFFSAVSAAYVTCMNYHENISFKYCQAKCDKMELENLIIFLNSFKKTPSCYFSKLGIWRPNFKKGLKRIYYSMRIWKKYDRYMCFFPKAIIRECCINILMRDIHIWGKQN